MKHRNPERMRQNARDAIPVRYPISVNQIFVRQGKPRLPRKEVAQLCEELVQAGLVEKIEINFMAYYRWKELAVVVPPAYNGPRRNEFSLVEEVDWFASTLYPLRQGVAVHLALDDPRFSGLKKYTGKKKKQLVILVPGPNAGLKPEYVLVSIVGSGSCLIRPHLQGQRIADLVLAGIPAKLATTLMNKLHLIFRS